MDRLLSRDQTVVAEQLADLVDGRVGRRQDQVGLVERSPGRAPTPMDRTPSSSAASAAANAISSPASTARLEGRVELVEPVQRGVGDVVLPLTQDPHDHGRPVLRGLGSGCSAAFSEPACMASAEPSSPAPVAPAGDPGSPPAAGRP